MTLPPPRYACVCKFGLSLSYTYASSTKCNSTLNDHPYIRKLSFCCFFSFLFFLESTLSYSHSCSVAVLALSLYVSLPFIILLPGLSRSIISASMVGGNTGTQRLLPFVLFGVSSLFFTFVCVQLLWQFIHQAAKRANNNIIRH